MIADDCEISLYALNAALSEYNLNIIQAYNGIEAIKELKRSEGAIDLILMDIMMPEMDGLTAIKEIKQNIKYCNIPIIIVSVKATDEDKEDSFKAGADDYITKPVIIEKLLEKVDTLLFPNTDTN